MTRRSTSQKTADENAWPIRVCVIVPTTGFSGAGIDPHTWLSKTFGLGGFAFHPAGRIGRDAVSIYFRTLADTQSFFDAFPTVELADDTKSPLYQSPYVKK